MMLFKYLACLGVTGALVSGVFAAEESAEKTYKVKRQMNYMIPMRDGVKVSLDIYRPDAPGKFPVILNRTPYDNNRHYDLALEYASQGYVFITGDARGRFDSDGKWEPLIYEANDGFDTQDWIGQQSWSNGKICTTGQSYEGWTQWLAAPQDSKYLTCMLPVVAPPHAFKNLPYENGVPIMFGAQWMLLMQGRSWQNRGRSLEGIFKEDFYDDVVDWKKVKNTLPMSDIDNAAGFDSQWWDDWMANDYFNEYWGKTNYQADINKIDVPIFQISGWYDHDFPGTFLNYPALVNNAGSKLARENQKLIITPFGHWHKKQKDGKFGSMDFGPAAALDWKNERKRWFDYWLKGIDNGVMDEPKVKVFVMGANRWREADTWPIPGTDYQEFYLHSDGHANTFHGDGELSRKAPKGDQPVDTYTYDPANPTPSSSELDPPMSFWGPEDLRSIHSRNDVLVYQTPALEEEVEVVGPITLKLYASSSAVDTDWFVRLSDVHPDGYAMRLGHGVLRARFRESISEPKMMVPGEVYEFTIDVWPTGNMFRKGHKIRLDIASSAFPLFGRNLNTGKNNQTTTEMVKANQTIYHSDKYPSRIILPVIPADK